MSAERYTLGGEQIVEIEKVKGSRFIGIAGPISSSKQMEERVIALWREYPEARHVCWAYRGAEQDIIRLVDDGEPSGTAARPILTVINGLGLENVGVAVVRYFGGTKLGTGGLARAYSSAAQAVLAEANRVTLKLRCSVEFNVEYSFEASLVYLLRQREAQILETRYAERVTVFATLLAEHVEPLIAEVTERTAGRAVIKREPLVWS